jgi:hypothetical protein
MLSESFQVLGISAKCLRHSLVLLAGFFHPALLNKILKLLIGPQAEHFLATAGGVPSSKTRMNDAKKRLEFIRFRVQQHVDQFFSDSIGTTARKGTELQSHTYKYHRFPKMDRSHDAPTRNSFEEEGKGRLKFRESMPSFY